MSNLSGFGLTGRLIAKHFGNLGDRLAQAIASFDPETATQADRDQLAATLRDAAQKLASAQAAYDREHNEVERLKKLIASDEQVAAKLAAKLQAGEISESAITTFCDELEANKGKLPAEQKQEADAAAYRDELKQIVDGLAGQLAAFDARAQAAVRQLEQAQAERDLQTLRQRQQEELSGLKSISRHSTALDALSKQAQRAKEEADGMRIVADIQQKPIDDAAAVQALRDSVTSPPPESALERLKRLASPST
ncbi:hypothetical protein [Burkholderia pseudomallei]|uniref:hypothetical protein n=1 Tax=Burkholderia pseudomallei TaxID=28450 RepID=UPI0005372DF7|nr:hypothetical protein [Burkholderia pseudomallei]KGV76372.1 hypothetical protein X890_2875 [Burkholderia pseudomallei MSHR4299]